jgi:site-specific DNA recombinase
MTPLQVALYARVSSEQQADAGTIASQLAALHTRITADGLALADALTFTDEGYSGATLQRPALEQLRDRMAAGEIDRLYVHCPDRLARNYAHQAVLLEEFGRAGVEVCFLDHAGDGSPEEHLLRQVQGVIAEYERAKFLERSRRGKRYAAQAGRVSVLGNAPYGYRYVPGVEGGAARFEVALEEARVVRQVFAWVGQERCTLSEVARRLEAAGVRTRTGKATWEHKTIWDMLRNPAYIGQAAFGRTRKTPLQPRLRAPRGRPALSRRGYSLREVPEEEWIRIPVPALVDEALFAAVREQLSENQRRACIPLKGSRYLLQGLLVCAQCGYAYCGRTNDARNAYYRCSGADVSRSGGTRLCWNKEVRMDQLDQAVWEEVCRLLEEPERLEQEYRQRLHPSQDPDEVRTLEAQIAKVQRGITRLIDGYTEGLLDKEEFEPRITHLRERLQHLEQQVHELRTLTHEDEEVRLVLSRFEVFAARVRDGLAQVDWTTRRELIRMLVRRVEIDQEQVRVVFRVSPTTPPPPRSEGGDRTGIPDLQPHGERVHSGRLHGDMGTARLQQPVA